MKKYINTFLLFGSLAFLVMWVDRILYKGEALRYNYFFLMFALAGFFMYVYRRGLNKMEKDKEANKTGKKTTRKVK